jgi:hypothetical protein
MIIPLIPEHLTVIVEMVKKQKMKEPQMMWILPIKVMELLKTKKESLPLSCELRTHLHPQALYAGIMSRPV